MSSPDHGPYKSRLLNLVLENYRAFIDSCGLAWRQLQFSTSTTVQTILFSVYSLLEGLVKGKQRLRSAQPSPQPQLEGMPENYQQPGEADRLILDTLIIARQEVKGSRRLKLNPNSVQAIASQLPTKKLVLVRTDNQILDVLSWRQKVKLRQYITRGVAELSKLRKLEKYPQSSPLQRVWSGAITVAQNYSAEITRKTEELGITLSQAWQKSSRELTVHTPENHSVQTSVSGNLHQVQAVIWAAIDYFFFKDHNLQLQSESQAENNILSGNPPKPQLTPQPPKSQPLIRYSVISNPGETSPSTSAKKIEKNSEKSLTNAPAYGLIMSDAIKYFEGGDRHETASDCLQAEATAVGYVKHPLEQVLEWLDRVLYWIEEAAIKAWKWAKQRWTAR
ncbi:hypothetical protein ACL6C3_24295 [Capilliphycus salinus ALCB114379]|uniref:hypothetical protein n=1 Tax=Capilliphycus salinus TaxID=2768948 RepID=UPI0039A66B33